MERAIGIDFADRQMSRSLFGNQDIDSVVLLLPDDNDQPEQKFVMRAYGG